MKMTNIMAYYCHYGFLFRVAHSTETVKLRLVNAAVTGGLHIFVKMEDL
jgi:hypothetical protein